MRRLYPLILCGKMLFAVAVKENQFTITLIRDIDFHEWKIIWFVTNVNTKSIRAKKYEKLSSIRNMVPYFAKLLRSNYLLWL